VLGILEVDVMKNIFLIKDKTGVLVLTHVKGHVYSVFGGTIKNLGMGENSYELIC